MTSDKRIIHFEGEKCPSCGRTYEVKGTRAPRADWDESFDKIDTFTCPCGYKFEWCALTKKEFTPHPSS